LFQLIVAVGELLVLKPSVNASQVGEANSEEKRVRDASHITCSLMSHLPQSLIMSPKFLAWPGKVTDDLFRG
jgi:hypothetical protein